MMENEGWPIKYQQSGAGNDISSTQVSLNNGEENNDKPATTTTSTAAASDEKAKQAQEDDTTRLEHNSSPTISEKATQVISIILEQISEFSNTEKYFLYLKLFQVSNVVDPLRHPLNPLGSRSEINRTISWIKTHLEEDPETSLPKQQVYEEYSDYCMVNEIKSLSQADFGKVMKQVYPKVRARRLGTRGNSRYCYSGLRRCIKLKPPQLPDLADKPLSTEAPCTLSNLTSASWLIVKEWSEIHFGIQFSSLQALARFLVVNHAIGVGSDAAHQLTSAAESQIRGELSKNGGNKHREMQIQLQKKIQQKNEGKERKRKTQQSPKCETRTKKSRSSSTTSTSTTPRLETSPTLLLQNGVGESTSTSTSTGSTSTSPTQGKPICDKSLDFTQLPALPDFKSFQKPVCDQPPQPSQQQNNLGGSSNNNSSSSNSNSSSTLKVAIPRLTAGIKAQQQRSPQSSPKKQVKNNAKYKAIQPKPQPCDNASYNPLQLNINNNNNNNADIRSQGVLHSVDRFKERKTSDDDNDCAPVFPLPRERLDSISNVDKDAMDEYLGTNNSQHEEELSKYFSNTGASAATDQDDTTKLSQLRQLLEQHGVSDSKFSSSSSSLVAASAAALPAIDPLSMTPVAHSYARGARSTVHIIPTNCNNNSTARRRVSFETPIQQEELASGSLSAAVPPSPNTRRKNFSFTPISPGPQSPSSVNVNNNNSGRQSKCSSTNVSPFVSPRNTPIPRTKNNAHQNAGIGIRVNNNNNNNNNNVISNKKIKREPPELSLEQLSGISAPTSPMYVLQQQQQQQHSKSVLEKLLHSNKKISYSDYNNAIKSDIASEISELLENGCVDPAFMYRSQSVPLSQMIKSNFNGEDQFLHLNNDFNDFDPIAETATAVGVERIIDSLDDQQPGVNASAGANPAAPANVSNLDSLINLPRFDLIAGNSLECGNFTSGANFTPCQRANLGRSQSIEVNGCYDSSVKLPSRSVPNTPLSFNALKLQQHHHQLVNKNYMSSRSYPSTPALVSEPAFNYAVNSDCLLNGQPIRSNGGGGGGGVGAPPQEAVTVENLYMYATDENNIERHLVAAGEEDEFGIDGRGLQANDFGGENGLMDENGVLIGEQNFDA